MLAKHNGLLVGVKSGDLALVDAGRPIDNREMQVTAAQPENEPLVTLIFDRLQPASARNAIHTSERMLSDFGAHPMLLGVWSIDSELRILEPYTVVKASVAKTLSLPSIPSVDMASLAMDHASSTTVAETRRIVAEQRGSWTYAALLAAARVQRERSGRKAIILFTEQPNLDRNAPDHYRELPEALSDAGISLFVVDANSLDADSSDQATLAVAMGGQAATNHYTALANLHSTAPLSQTQGMAPLQYQAMKDTISTFEAGGSGERSNLVAYAANVSGGAYLFSGSGTKKFSQKLLAGLDSYVTVTYTVPAGQQDGRFHSVSVRSLRSGVSVLAQPGYFAARPTNSAAANSPVASFDPVMEGDPGLLEKGAIDAALALDAAALRFGASSSGARSIVAVEVPISQLRLEEDEHTRLFSLHATAAFELVGVNGVPIARFQQEFRHRGALETKATLASQVLLLHRQVTLPAGEYILNAIVRDWNADTFGKTTRRIVIPTQVNPTSGGDLLSDLVVVRSLVEGGVDATAAALQYGDKQVVPSLSGSVGPGNAKATLYFQSYNVSTVVGTAAASRSISLTLSKDGKRLASVPLQVCETHLDGIATHLFTVALSRGPGRYDIAVDLKDGTETTTRRASLTLAAPEAPSTGTQLNDSTESSAERGTEAFIASRETAAGAGASSVVTPPLPAAQSASLLAAARENALNYSEKLPNFICEETIRRSSDRSGAGEWKARDTIVESLHYQDKVEQRAILKINGDKSSLPADRIEGARSNGEFGTLLRAIFEPTAKADFTWVQSEERNGDLLEVFRFNVLVENSRYTVTDHTNSRVNTAFHGLVVVDTATRSVRRLFAQTDGLPHDFGVRSSWIAMNYDYVQINNHDYLLPSRGEIGLQQGKHEVLVNEIEFSQYRRFGARSHLIIPGSPETLQ